MKPTILAMVALVGALGVSTGCASKNYVKNEMTPVVNKTNELDDLTAKNTRDIKDVDARAQQGIKDVNDKAAAADQKAQAAGQQADQAQNLATQASTGVNTLTQQVINLDNYHPVVETSVHFGFDKADLTKKAKDALDQLAQEVPNQKHYVISVAGDTDSTGPADYNYQLSQRRADAVIQYLVTKYNIPAHKIYVIGLGKDKPAASNASKAGRAKNRRVEVRLLTNSVESSTSAQNATPAQPQAQPR